MQGNGDNDSRQGHEDHMLMRPNLLMQALFVVLAVFVGPAGAGAFTAGAGRADILIPADLYPLDGFVGQHDPLAVRVLLLDDGRERIAIIVVDQTSISDKSIADMKAIVNKVAGVLPNNAIVCASHTFSVPHVLPPQNPADKMSENIVALERVINAAVQTAATQAVSTLQPARLGLGTGTSRVNINRDVQTPAGWWLGANDAGYIDPSLGVLRIDGVNGKPLALLMNFAVQPSIMDGSESGKGGKLITADLAGAATRYVESQFGPGVVSAFLIGAAGDQAPYLQANRHVVNKDGSVSRDDIHDAGFALVDLLGERLGKEAVQVAESIVATQMPILGVQRMSVEVTSQAASHENAPTGPVMSYEYQPGAQIEVPVVLMRIGGIALVGLQAELAASIGARIKAGSSFPNTIIVTMVDGAAKYMPDAASYDRFTYEARSSRYARGSAETTASAVVNLLNQMHDASAD
jgi:hypothetical protein